MGKLIKPGEEPTFYSDADDSDEEENEDKKTQWFSKSKIKKHSKKRFKSLEFSDPFHKNSFVISAAKAVFTTGLNSNGCSFLDLKVQSPLNTYNLFEIDLPNVLKVQNCNFNDLKICQKSKPFNLDKQFIYREEN